MFFFSLLSNLQNYPRQNNAFVTTFFFFRELLLLLLLVKKIGLSHKKNESDMQFVDVL